jgi:hypothetical protein
MTVNLDSLPWVLLSECAVAAAGRPEVDDD